MLGLIPRNSKVVLFTEYGETVQSMIERMLSIVSFSKAKGLLLCVNCDKSIKPESLFKFGESIRSKVNPICNILFHPVWTDRTGIEVVTAMVEFTNEELKKNEETNAWLKNWSQKLEEKKMFDERAKAVAAELDRNAAEWEANYARYAEALLANESKLKNNKTQFNEFKPLYLYSNVSDAMDSGTYNLRYRGQGVADLKIGRDGVLRLSMTADHFKNNTLDFECDIDLRDGVPWHSAKATDFRKFFRDNTQARRRKGKEEHRKESLLLTEFLKDDSDVKQLLRVQPVRLFDHVRFQLPTPLSASGGKGFIYSSSKGGGIDILSRVGKGRGTRLCVMEVKKANTSAEPPAIVIKQAITYAVFLWKLLRSEKACGQKWYNIFGYKGTLPKRLTILAAAVMPPSDKTESGFEKHVIQLSDTDKLVLHTVFFEEKDNVITGITPSWDVPCK